MRAVWEGVDGKRVFLFRALIGLGFVRRGMGIGAALRKTWRPTPIRN